MSIWKRLVEEDRGQDVAEYAVMLAVILVIAMAAIRYIGAGANDTFAAIASKIQ
jgi:Flp pilus assembly pilin Flp